MKNIIYFIISLFFKTFNRLRGIFYKLKLFDQVKFDVPVISVGNISFGGTGKTPVSIELVKILLSYNFRPAVIIRGYRGKLEKKGAILSYGERILLDEDSAGDEAVMIAKNLKIAGVFIGKNRINSIKKAKDSGFNIIILDDGFQYRKIKKDIEIVLFDHEDRTPRREGLSSLKRADIIMIRNGIHDKSIKKFLDRNIYEYRIEPIGIYDGNDRLLKENVSGKKVIAFCGIANPAKFLETLNSIGLEVVNFVRFSDHHRYTRKNIKKMESILIDKNAEFLITTEKDMIKIKNLKARYPMYYLKIKAQFNEKFLKYFENTCIPLFIQNEAQI
ncbi:MAG: tetraacyldisaccharide 4'-kinase [Acidobacteriota bacterium]